MYIYSGLNLTFSCLFPPGISLIGTVLRVLQYQSEGKDDATSRDATKDEQLQTLAEITAEFLADICIQIPQVKKTSEMFCLFRFLTKIL